MTLWCLYGAHEAPRRAVELARSQELARFLYRRLDTADVRERGVIRQAVQDLGDTRLGSIRQGGGPRCPETLDSKVARSQSLLQLALDRRYLEDLVEIGEHQDVEGLARPLPVIVIDLVDKLGTDILAHFLEQLAEQVREQGARGDDTLVGICITIILWDLAVGRIKELLDHTRNDLDLACNQNLRAHRLTREGHVGKELGEKQGLDVRGLVLDCRRILEVVRQVFYRFLLGEHPDIRTLLE